MSETAEDTTTYNETCPWCGYALRDLWDYGMTEQDDQAEIECGRCERPILVTLHISATYEAARRTPIPAATEPSPPRSPVPPPPRSADGGRMTPDFLALARELTGDGECGPNTEAAVAAALRAQYLAGLAYIDGIVTQARDEGFSAHAIYWKVVDALRDEAARVAGTA